MNEITLAVKRIPFTESPYGLINYMATFPNGHTQIISVENDAGSETEKFRALLHAADLWRDIVAEKMKNENT